MPTIKRFRSCRIEMYFGDHNPPHFHVVTAGLGKAVVDIRTLAVITGNVKDRDIAEAIEWAQANRATLMQLWTKLSE